MRSASKNKSAERSFINDSKNDSRLDRFTNLKRVNDPNSEYSSKTNIQNKR